MSPERDEVIARLWKRLSSVTGVKSTARNPVNPPSDADMPRVNFFEMDDVVTAESQRGSNQYPNYKRELTVLVECFIKGSSEMAGPKELGTFVKELKKKLYEGGITLGLRGVSVSEKSCGELLRPPGLDLVCGVGVILSIRYVEDTATLFT